MSKTNSTAKKFAAGVVSFAMSVSFVFGGAVAPAQAQTVESLAATIAGLNATIAALSAQLAALTGGSTTTGGATTTGGTGYQFNVSLSLGDTGNDVKELQMLLNTDPATQVAVSGAGSPGNETTYFGPATKAAVVKFQNKYATQVLTPVNLTSGTGYFGSSSRTFANTMGTGSTNTGSTGTTPTVPTGSTLGVTLASDSPAASVLVVGQAIGDLAHFTFTNTSSTEAKVTKLMLNRTGVSSDSVLSNVYLFDGATRLTDAASVSVGVVTLSNPSAGLFTVPAGTSRTISVRSDISGGSGQVVGVSLASVESTVTVAGSFPVAGAVHSIATGTMGTVALTYTGPTGATENPASDVRVFEAQTVVSTNDARLESLTIENRGTSADGDLQNFKLYIDGVQVGSTVAQTVGDKAVFDLSSNPEVLKTGTRIIKVLADVVKGSSETFDIQIRKASDLRVIDTEFNQPILATTFSVGAGSANTIAAGSLSVTKANNSPSKTVAVGASNVLWGSYEFRATGEDVKIEAVTIDTDNSVLGTDTMDNVKVFVNGSQVGSTRDVTADTGTEFTFGSSFVALAGEVTKVDVYGDAKTSAAVDFTAGSTVDVGVTIAAADTEGLSSGNTVSAISEVEGNSRTVVASTLTATKSTGYGGATLIAGTNNAKIGSFVLSAGSTEGINVNTVVVNLPSADSASITDLMLKSGGTQIGTTKSVPSTDNSFSVNFEVPASETKTIDIYANIKSGADAGTIIATIDSTSGGTGAVTANSATTGSDVALQTITVGSGTLTVEEGSSPTDSIVLDGSTDVKVGTFRLSAVNSDFTVRELKVKIPSDAATSVSNVILKNGSTVLASQQPAGPSTSQTHATATFTGLSLAVERGADTLLDVYVDVTTIASANANISGKAITVLLDADEGFVATDSAGTEDTSLAGSDLDSAATTGEGTVYVRHSIPTISSSVNSGSDSASFDSNDTVLGNFTVEADASAPIYWKKFVFNVSKTSGVTVGATSSLSLKDSGGNTITGTFSTTSGSLLGGLEAISSTATTGNLIFIATSEEEIPAGTSEAYKLEGDIGTGGSGTETLNLKIKALSSSVSTAAYATLHTSAADVSESFVWSDNAADVVDGSHSESSLDWTNDELVIINDVWISKMSLTN
jgi:hypothetical protein